MNRLLLFTALAIVLVSSSTKLLAQNALHFDGSNDKVQTTFPGVLGSNARTFEAWIYITQNPTSNMCIVDYGLNAVGSRNTFSVGPSNKLVFISGGTNANMSSSNNVITINQWNHVAFVLDSGTGYMYVNGTQVGSGNLSTVNTPSTGANMTIGERVSGGSIPFNGRIDEVRIWNVALSSSELIANMSDEFCQTDSNRVGYYKLNEGLAGGTNTGQTTAADASGNGNNGTLQNFSLSGSTSNWVTGYPLNQGFLTSSITVIGCDGSYTSPSGQTYTTAGTYVDTVLSVTGCDSVITIDLSFASSSSSTVQLQDCDSIISPSGNFTILTSGTYHDTLMNAAGCDSVITIDAEVLRTFSTPSIETCYSYVLPSGSDTVFFSGTYHDTIPNNAGCDSIMTISVTILGNGTSTLNEETCISYTAPSGSAVYTTSGTYFDTLTASNGCDSIITIFLTIDTVNTNVSLVGNLLSAQASQANYQWIDCDGNSPIEGATGKLYGPTQTGNYAVIVTQNGCSDTSECTEVIIVGTEPISSDEQLVIFPNPTNGSFKVHARNKIERLEILDSKGQKVYECLDLDSSKIELNTQFAKGVYSVIFQVDGKIVLRKLVIN